MSVQCEKQTEQRILTFSVITLSSLKLCSCKFLSQRFVAFSAILLKGYGSLTVHILSIKLKVVKRVKRLVDKQADITVSSLLRLKLG